MLTSIIVHRNLHKKFKTLWKTIQEQTHRDFEVIILTDHKDEKNDLNLDTNFPVKILSAENQSTLGSQLNRALKESKGQFVLYVHNIKAEILLKQAALDLFCLTMEHHPRAGMIYADYELEEEGAVKEIHLLKHHPGRVRDNQDYGEVFYFRKAALESVGFCDPKLKFNTLYDLRLKLAEKYELVHIANRYAGSLFRIVAESKEHNVFDYLLASKESQTEAEEVVNGHLKRIQAYLPPHKFYQARPQASARAKLKASVIIPVNNRPQFVGVAIESIQAQTVPEVEAIIVVNGGADDPTIREVKRYMAGGDKYSPNKPQVKLLVYDINNLGLCLNMGAKIAEGAYYVQLDSDDRLKPNAVEKILQVYESDNTIGMVIGSYEVWELDDHGNYSRMEELPVVTHDEWTEENGRNNLLRVNGAGAPRSIPIALINEIGFSVNDEPYARNYGEDYHMVLQISERHRIGRVWEAIYEVVRHSGGTDHSIDQATIDRNDEAKDYMRLQAILRRQKLNQKG